MSEDFEKSAQAKVEEIFAHAFGERAKALFLPATVEKTMRAIKQAHVSKLSSAKAEALGFHMADWSTDAAFIIAVHLFPERFSQEELRSAVFSLAMHVPYHVNNVADILEVSDDTIQKG